MWCSMTQRGYTHMSMSRRRMRTAWHAVEGPRNWSSLELQNFKRLWTIWSTLPNSKCAHLELGRVDQMVHNLLEFCSSRELQFLGPSTACQAVLILLLLIDVCVDPLCVIEHHI